MRLSTHILAQPVLQRAVGAVFVAFGLGSVGLLPPLGAPVAQCLALMALLIATAAAIVVVPVERVGERWLHVLPALVALETGVAMLIAAPNQGPVALVILINGPLLGFMAASRGWLVGLLAFTSVVLASATVLPGSSDVSAVFAVATSVGVCGFGLAIYEVWGLAEHQSRKLERLGQRDPLTGLANRRLLDERMAYELTRHERADRELSVLVLDLNGFKAVNDTLGHLAGDELLRDVAEALRGAAPAQHTIARLGGDEFCILAPETAADGARALTEAVTTALASISASGQPLSAGIGCATFPGDARDAQALIARADARLLADKPARMGAVA